MIISIILPIHNGLNYTKSCIHSLIQEHEIENKHVKYSLIIIDDGSIDGSKEWIKKNYPQVIVLNGDGSLWWSGGINKGISYAINELNTDYILWWNNDIIADKNYFDNLIKIIKQADFDTIVGSKIFLFQQKNIVWSMGGLFDPYSGKKEMIGMGKQDHNGLQKPTEVDWLPGMGTLIHKTIFDKIGFVDEKTFPQYHGDSDFIYRAKVNGCKIIVYPSLKIYNDTTSSGLRHQDSFIRLIRSMFTIRSNYNIKKDFQFYRRYSKSNRAYMVLFSKYFRYVGGFLKWKVLRMLGFNR